MSSRLDRRELLTALAATGVGSVVFARALAAEAALGGGVTAEMIEQAEWVAGVTLTEEERIAAARAVASVRRACDANRASELPYETPPAFVFQPGMPPATSGPAPRRDAAWGDDQPASRPSDDAELAFLPVRQLSKLIASRQVSSVELTRLYLARLAAFNPSLNCVITRTEKLALAQAKAADQEIAAGRRRGPLHGIPWGAKDLIAWPGYPTTWGAEPFVNQTFKTKATVARRLEAAGAVLVAKLTLGALAWGDEYFGGQTRNPWNLEEGASGSSSGSAASVAAGLVGFTLGSETMGSILSPSRRCGATGLRPSFGRVSRHGCMALAWTLDKIGPLARSVEDCALVFAAIHGRDGRDPTAVDRPFQWPPRQPLSEITVGYSEAGPPLDEREPLRALEMVGCRLQPVELPSEPRPWALSLILDVEAAAMFDPLARGGPIEGLEEWQNAWRRGQFTSAVEYIRAQRLRSKLIEKTERALADVDVLVDVEALVLTNLTGHPQVSVPGPLTRRNDCDVPSAVVFTGRMFGEEALLAVAHAYQEATGHHLRRPPLDNPPTPEG